MAAAVGAAVKSKCTYAVLQSFLRVFVREIHRWSSTKRSKSSCAVTLLQHKTKPRAAGDIILRVTQRGRGSSAFLTPKF